MHIIYEYAYYINEYAYYIYQDQGIHPLPSQGPMSWNERLCNVPLRDKEALLCCKVWGLNFHLSVYRDMQNEVLLQLLPCLPSSTL